MRATKREAGQRDQGGRLHLRLTLVTKKRSHTLVLPPLAIALLLGLVPIAGALYLGATCYFMFHDDLLAHLTQHQIAMQYSYEDRLAQLRHEILNLTQHAKVNEAELTERLGALLARQDMLESRTTLVASLAERAKALHATAAAQPAVPAELISGPYSPDPNEFTPAGAGEPKPKPVDFDLRLETQSTSHAPAARPQPLPDKPVPSPLSFDYGQPLATRLLKLAARQQRLERTQMAILGSLAAPAETLSSKLKAAFNAVGLAATQLALPAGSAKPADMGGPFVPLPMSGGDNAVFVRAATEAQTAIASAERLRTLAIHVPFAMPLTGQAEVTSPFGARIDPFLGKPALHTGIDLREDYGAPVKATAAGVVAFAGADGGYGNMVEIDHGNGLSTRYAHLSAITVREGQKVEIGSVLGRIGETGRATGPHLHYETRINGEPVDPARFLRAGLRLRGAADSL